jgi:hypothetical protein
MRRLSALALVAALATCAVARAEWLQPDPSFRDAQFALRSAARDTAGHAGDAPRLDTLGVALLRLGREGEAETIFRRVLPLVPGDDAAEAGLGKLALFHDRLAEAESLLAGAGSAEPEALADLLATRVRRGDYAGGAKLAAEAGQEGRLALLERLAEGGAYEVSGPDEVRLVWARTYPVPLVRVKLNGLSVLMAIDTGAGELLVDESFARRCGIAPLAGQSLVFWCGTRVAVKNAVVPRLELGAMRIGKVPAGILPLHRWSLEVNPQSESVAGVIGLALLRRFTPTIDYAHRQLELRRPGHPIPPATGAARVPFEIWGENELTVFGSLAGGRRMALVVATGLPGGGIGAPQEVLDEIGVKSGTVSRMMKNAGTLVRGRAWLDVTVPSVAIGPVVRDKVPGWSGALDSAELWRHGVRRDAILAGEFFRGRRLSIDWGRLELVIEEKD